MKVKCWAFNHDPCVCGIKRRQFPVEKRTAGTHGCGVLILRKRQKVQNLFKIQKAPTPFPPYRRFNSFIQVPMETNLIVQVCSLDKSLDNFLLSESWQTSNMTKIANSFEKAHFSNNSFLQTYSFDFFHQDINRRLRTSAKPWPPKTVGFGPFIRILIV